MKTFTLAFAVCFLAAGCATQKEQLNQKEKASIQAEKTKSGVQREKEFEKAERAAAADEKNRKKQGDKVPVPEPLETSSTTEQMFKPEGIRKLQEQLQNKMKAYADAQPTDKEGKEKAAEKREKDPDAAPPEPIQVDENGKLDARTQAALRAFQKEQKLPETGLPDYATLKKLGIKPDELFEKMPSAQKEEDAEKRSKAEGKDEKKQDKKLSGKEKDEANEKNPPSKSEK